VGNYPLGIILEKGTQEGNGGFAVFWGGIISNPAMIVKNIFSRLAYPDF